MAPSTGEPPARRTMGGRYRLGEVLGEGGMGTVHAALDTKLGRPVAVKVLKDGVASDEHLIARLEREARAAARLAHPNVVGVTELVRDDELGLGLVMEQLIGESLSARLRRGPLLEGEAVSIFTQALDGLKAAHAAGMIHRDLKPSNIFLVPIAGSVLVKILDFGIVKLTEEALLPKLTRQGALIGTPTYMSPEQVACEPVDATSDVYSVGACLYEGLVAHPPYEAPHSLALVVAVGAGPPRDLRELDPNVSPDLVHVVRVAMARDPRARYQSAEAMRNALERAVIDPQRSARSASVAPTVLTPPESARGKTPNRTPGSSRGSRGAPPASSEVPESPVTMDPTLSMLPLWKVAVGAGCVIAAVGALVFFGSRSPETTEVVEAPVEEPRPLETPRLASPPTAVETPADRPHHHVVATPEGPPTAPETTGATITGPVITGPTAPETVPTGIDPPAHLTPVALPERGRPPRRVRTEETTEPFSDEAPAPEREDEPEHSGRVGESVMNPFD